MASIRPKYFFYAEVSKGYTVKVLIDVLTGFVPRATFNVNREGIYIQEMDKQRAVMFDVAFPRENFRQFKCRKKLSFSVNLKHLQKMARTIKKKNSVILFIDKTSSDEMDLKLKVQPAADDGKKNTLSETMSVVAQAEPEWAPLTTPPGDYKYPMVIEATSFQKVKKLAAMDDKKGIRIKIQGTNYLGFFADARTIKDDLEFGTIQYEDEAKLSNSEDTDTDSDDTENDEPETYDIYEASFSSNIFSHLVKLPGLCTQMQFYAPTNQEGRFPLRIQAIAGTSGTLGTVNVYVKDLAQIAFEERLREQDSQRAVISSTRTKKKKN